MITDFSSIAVDYAIAGSNIVYFQFDREEYYKNHTAKKGWFDYDLDGFGPVFFNIKDLINYIERFNKGNIIDKEIYKNRLDNLLLDDYQMIETPSQNVYNQIVKHLDDKRGKVG
jgi:CDP-glycerol glycerophosphotransferase (TagB/SpsB family)